MKKPSGSIACTRKQQPRFYWSGSSVVMNDATPLTPLAHEQSSIFKCKQHTCTVHDPWGPEKYDYTMSNVKRIVCLTFIIKSSITTDLITANDCVCGHISSALSFKLKTSLCSCFLVLFDQSVYCSHEYKRVPR